MEWTIRMNTVRLIPVFLSALLMAAHVMRATQLPWAILCLALTAVLAVRGVSTSSPLTRN